MTTLRTTVLFVCAVIGPTVPSFSQSAPPCERTVLTLQEAADLLRVPPEDLARLAERNEVPARRIESSWRFSCSALLEWLGQDRKAVAPLTTEDLSKVTAAGTAPGQAATPVPSQGQPVGEAPDERPAEDIFLRGQRVLLGRGDVVLDFGQFYSRRDEQLLATFGGGLGLSTLQQETFTTVLMGRVGIFNETELFGSTTFHSQDNHQFLGSTTLGNTVQNTFGGLGLGLRRTLLREKAGRPDIVATVSGNIPLDDGPYALGGGLVVVKSVDPVVLFASGNYIHAFSRGEPAGVQTEDAVDVSMGYGIALNDSLAISMSVAGAFTGPSVLDNVRFRQPSVFGARFALTSWLARGLYIEPSVGFGLSGPGRSFTFGVTLPYSF